MKEETGQLIQLILTLVGIPFVILGIKWARIKRVSLHWFWFALLPFGAIIVYAIIRWRVKRVNCPTCNTPVSVKINFCPFCKTQIGNYPSTQNQQLIESMPPPQLQEQLISNAEVPRIFRWSKNQVQCVSCRNYVSLKSEFCLSCSAPAPRLECPLCGSNKTWIVASKKTITLGSVFLILMVGAAIAGMRVKSGNSPVITQDPIFTGVGSLFFILSALCFGSLFTKFSKRIRCYKCNDESKIEADNIKVIDSIKAE